MLVETADIADLETALKATAKNDMKTVFTNLLDASLAHQEDFESTLEVLAATGERARSGERILRESC